MRKPPAITTTILVALVAALTLYACNALARWGGAAGGAGIGAAVAGPLGAAGGAVAGDALGDALAPEKPEPTTVIHNVPGGTVNAGIAAESSPWWMDWRVLVGGAFLFYRRAPLLRAAKSATSLRALGLNLWSALWASESAAERSKRATVEHKARRNVVVT